MPRSKVCISLRSKAALRSKKMRAKQTPEQLEAHRAACRERARKKRQLETPEEHQARIQYNRELINARRARCRDRQRVAHRNAIFQRLTEQVDQSMEPEKVKSNKKKINSSSKEKKVNDESSTSISLSTSTSDHPEEEHKTFLIDIALEMIKSSDDYVEQSPNS